MPRGDAEVAQRCEPQSQRQEIKLREKVSVSGSHVLLHVTPRYYFIAYLARRAQPAGYYGVTYLKGWFRRRAFSAYDT